MQNPTIVYEDKNFLAVNKPVGWLTHHAGANKGKVYPALTDWLLERYPEIKGVGDEPALRPGIVHRLDRETSGLILIPKNQETFLRFKVIFQAREMKKKYLALVYGRVTSQGRIDKDISLKPGTTRRTVRGGKMTKPAITEYSPKEYFKDDGGNEFTLLKVSPLTGRTHQIRVHLASINHPIAGDKMYGKKKDAFSRLMLHAFSLELETEKGKKVMLEAEPPEDFDVVLKDLKRQD